MRAARDHELKIWPTPFAQVLAGKKVHEVRVFDRDYCEGDHVILREYNPQSESYTGRSVRALVGYVSEPGSWGLPKEVGAFSLLNVTEQ